MCCMAEPKVYEILRWQLAQVHKHLQPDGYFLQHDEIRVQGWDESCRRTGKTPGELLAENVRKCQRSWSFRRLCVRPRTSSGICFRASRSGGISPSTSPA